jgi:hypothetical protein
MFTGLFRKTERIDSLESLARFLDSRSNFLSQKCITEFCRVRSGVYWQKLFQEQEFLSALEVSCWQAYTPCLAMVTEMVEANLRPAAGAGRRAAAQRLVDLARAVHDSRATPPGFDAAQWAASFQLVAERIDSVEGEAARPVRLMPDPLARKVFEALPIHPRLITNDYDYIFNNLRMNLLRAHEDFADTADPRILAGLLTA